MLKQKINFMLMTVGGLLVVACQQPHPGCDFSQADLDSLKQTHATATGPMHENPGGMDWNKFAEMQFPKMPS